jgi:IS4 transposase
MPQVIERVPTGSSDSEMGAKQVEILAERDTHPKVVVADSLYCNAVFLQIFLVVQWVYALVRIKHNQVLYEEAPERQSGQKGRPRKQGAKFRLSAPWRQPDRSEKSTLLGQTVCLQAWQGRHFHQVPFLVGMVVSVQFLRTDGTPRFKRPLLLFWSGPPTVALVDLAQMYLWRFAIEHLFRFLKQQLGLTRVHSPNLAHRQRWIWCCALAYCQLLLMRHQVADQRPAWHPRYRSGRERPLTPGQVRRQALTFLLRLGTPARPAQPAGKGRGRATGYCPEPRKRFSVVKKGKKDKKSRQTA